MLSDCWIKKGLAVAIIVLFVGAGVVPSIADTNGRNKEIISNMGWASVITVLGNKENSSHIESKVTSMIFSEPIVLDFSFSDPTFKDYHEFVCVYVDETNLNSISDGVPVLPVNLTVLDFPLGTNILSVEYDSPPYDTLDLDKKISFGKCSPRGTEGDKDIYENSGPFPNSWVTYHTGGGLFDEEHVTFLALRINPVRYLPLDDQIQYINELSVTITYHEPDQQVIDDNSLADLLILAPSKFKTSLQPLVDHKNDKEVKTTLVTLEDVYDEMFSQGRDQAEKVKYYIKDAIENQGISYVLLVGGLNGQFLQWNCPVRYSHVVPPDEQEYAEGEFTSDLYFADIYNSLGGFSSWDSDGDNVFAEWDETFKEEMDLYPDVYLGRLACRNIFEVITMVNKIITYEKDKCDKDWFKNLVLVAGDSYPDADGLIEGELICEKAYDLMPGFTPVRVYAAEDKDIDRTTVKNAMDPGCGFAYFCGHGNPKLWATHFPPDGTGWTTGFKIFDMIYLNNHEKLPIGIIGGCHNNQFDVSILNLFEDKRTSLQRTTWVPRCWAWFLTVKIGGGAIATIGSTGLGTHGREDADNNDIADYLEVLDGWLELYFFELYGKENIDILGKNHGITMTEYLHRFLGSNEKMDTKMVQQWVLFGDPSLKIGGYEKV